MGTPAFNRIAPLHAIILVPDIIAATAIIEAAVVVIITVAVAVIIAHAILMANATGATPGGGLIPMTHHNHNRPDITATDHDLTEGIALAAEASLNPQEDVTAIDPILQIANIPGVP